MVRDNVTGLIWEVKTDDGSVHDKDNHYDWQDARDVFISDLNAQHFGSYEDWRVPTIKELSSILNLGRNYPAVDTVYFPNTLSSSYWSSSTAAGNSGNGWGMAFYSGHDDDYYNKSGSYSVRAVRGGRAGAFNHLVLNPDGTVTDTATGLMWRQTMEGEMTWESAISHCEGLSAADYTDWRLPNRRELRSIADYSLYSPAIDTVYFPDTVLTAYWSSSSYLNDISHGWVIVFDSGRGSHNDKSNAKYVRAVRGGQNGAPDRLFISSPAQASVLEKGSTLSICWNTRELGGNVKISISRDGGKTGTFETVVDSTENDGAYDWTVTGDSSVNCVLKIEPVSEPSKGTTQGLFSIVSSASPVVQISETPGSPTNSNGATFNVSGDGVTHYRYKLDAQDFGLETPVSVRITLENLPDGSHEISVIGRNAVGNWQAEIDATGSGAWRVDTKAPSSSAAPAGGNFGTAIQVTLSCDDGSGAGCTAVYYTLDGNDPTVLSGTYGLPISISETTTLKFFAVDSAGNAEPVNTENYIRTYTLTTSSTSGGSVTTPGEGVNTYPSGTVVDLDATPETGHRFVKWTGDVADAGLPSTTVTMDGDKTVTASFALNQYTVTVNSTPGGTTDRDGPNPVDHDGFIKITATPSEGYAFTEWRGDASGSENPLTVNNITSDKSITANFDSLTPTVSTCSPNSGSIAGGTPVTLSGERFLGTRGSGKVTFGGVEATSYTSWTDTAVVCVTPAHGIGSVDVVLTAENGLSATASQGFTFIADSDSDGMDDNWEMNHFGNLSHDGTGDSDDDGLTDLQEHENGTDPNDGDSDADGMPDGWEVDNLLNPNTDDSGADADGDQFANGREYQDGTDPNAASSHMMFRSGMLSDTGQTTCYNGSEAIACPADGEAFLRSGCFIFDQSACVHQDGRPRELPGGHRHGMGDGPGQCHRTHLGGEDRWRFGT